MNLTNAPLHEVYHKAELSGIKNIELATLPEQDHWLYNTTRYG